MNMDSTSSHPRDVVLGVGHLVVGAAGFAFGGFLVVASQAPGAELETALFLPGLAIMAVGLAFACAALFSFRSPGGPLHVVLGVLEFFTGAGLLAGAAVAISGYGAFEPWRSPLLVPSLVLIALGLWAVRRTFRARPE
ncbi:hypothetical protein [Terrabacter sp. 2RAF25]|uniref:hypothetical protein n=1 Tax=Terrabacter sp. 2RAF25 TaxID=3232998 RepID=UPI003F9620F0